MSGWILLVKRPINVSLHILNAHLIYCNRIFLYFSDKLFKPEFLANKWTSLILKFHSVDYEVSLASLEDPSLLIYTCQFTSTAWEWLEDWTRSILKEEVQDFSLSSYSNSQNESTMCYWRRRVKPCEENWQNLHIRTRQTDN